MKKLICGADIQALAQQQQKECLIDKQTIITPAAVDLAEELGIQLVQRESSAVGPLAQLFQTTDAAEILTLLTNKELLSSLTKLLQPQRAYDCETDASGMKLIHGQTTTFAAVSAGTAKQILFEDLFQQGIAAETVKLERGCSEQLMATPQLHTVISGKMAVSINGRTYQAVSGDTLYYPKAARVRWQADDEVRLSVIRSAQS